MDTKKLYFSIFLESSLPPGDLSEMFTVPRAQTNTSSMFKNPQSSQFDRGLYLTFVRIIIQIFCFIFIFVLVIITIIITVIVVFLYY